jgi:hypothetical protein
MSILFFFKLKQIICHRPHFDEMVPNIIILWTCMDANSESIRMLIDEIYPSVRHKLRNKSLTKERMCLVR